MLHYTILYYTILFTYYYHTKNKFPSRACERGVGARLESSRCA